MTGEEARTERDAERLEGKNKPRLAVFTFAQAYCTSGRYSTDATFQHMLVPLLQVFGRIDLCVPVVAAEDSVGREPIEEDINVVHLPGYSNGIQKYITRLLFVLTGCVWLFLRRRRDWDLVWIVDSDIHSQFVYLLCKLFRLRTCLYLRGREDLQGLRANNNGLRRPLLRLLGRWIGWATVRMVRGVPTIVTGDELREMYEGQTNHLYRFVSSLVRDEFVDSFESGDSTKNPSLLLTVGRVAPVKGLHVLMAAVARLQDNPPIRLRFVGPIVESYRAELQAAAERLGLGEVVSFAGPIPFGRRLWYEYAQASIYVQPSLSEGTPKTLIEAMAAGLPIVATSVGGIPELVLHEWNGLLVPPSNPAAMAHALERLLRDSKLRELMGSHSRLRAREFTLDSQIQGLVSFLDGIFPGLFPVQTVSAGWDAV